MLSSPSGAGKTTITRALVAQDSKLAISVSATTRPMRRGEIDGQDYYFLDQARFAALVREDGLLEHATVFNHSYGTPRAPVIEALERGSDIISDVDWQGTQQLKPAGAGGAAEDARPGQRFRRACAHGQIRR